MARPRLTSGVPDDVPKLKFNKQNIKEGLMIFKYIKPYKTKFIGGLIVIGLSACTTMAFPYFLKGLIDSANNSGTGIFATMSANQIALLMVGLLTIQIFISFLRVYFLTTVGEHAVADMRKDIYRHMIMMPMDFFAKRRVGELSSRISADVSQIQDTVTTVLAELLRGVLTLVIGLILIFTIAAKLALVMLSVIPVIIVIALVFSKKIRNLARGTQDQLADSGTIVQETLQGAQNVKSFANEWFEVSRYNKSITSVVNMAIKNGIVRGLFISFMLFSVFGTIVLVIWYGAGLMQSGHLTFGEMSAFVIYTAFVGGTMGGFADMFAQLQKTLGATQRVRDILREDTENVSVTEVELNEKFKLYGSVEMEHVAFSYPSRKEVPVLKDINLRAEPGEQIAIVGPSGAGKSTMAAMLLRFYEPDGGSLKFDGRDAKEMPLTQLRKQMALVPQDILLFGGTIFENIAYGEPNASQAEVEAAARKANAHDFISSFPEGYQTVVGERGIKLSGGQRQRIAIARAILKDPVILILDEATSSLDSESEALVQDALQNLMKGRTSFIIAHRLSTIRNADKIVVLEHGVIRESGTHEQLLAIDGLYKSLNRLQFELN